MSQCARGTQFCSGLRHCNQKMLLQIKGKIRERSKKGGSHDVEIPGVAKAANCGQSQKGSNVAEARDIG